MRLIDTLDRPSTQQLDIGDLTKISLRSLSAYQPVSQPLTYIDLNRVSDKSMIYSSLPFILYGNHIHIIWKTTSETNEKIENIGVSYATSSFYIAGNTPFFKEI